MKEEEEEEEEQEEKQGLFIKKVPLVSLSDIIQKTRLK